MKILTDQTFIKLSEYAKILRIIRRKENSFPNYYRGKRGIKKSIQTKTRLEWRKRGTKKAKKARLVENIKKRVRISINVKVITKSVSGLNVPVEADSQNRFKISSYILFIRDQSQI